MKKYNYSRLARSAKRLIDRFGGDLTFVVISQTANTDAWKPASTVPVEIVVTGIVTREEDSYENGVLVHKGKEKILFYKKDTLFDPNLTGQVKRGSEVWKFKNIKTVNPAGTVIIYTAEVER